MMLPEGMDFYNYKMKGSDLARVISDCYQSLGRRQTISLLDDMNQLGFKESTRSGLSFATDDLVTPDTKETSVAKAEKEVLKLRKLYERGVITEKERYNKVLEQWTHAREEITKHMMSAMEADDRGGHGYINPVYLMAHSGARGGVEQIRQLAGMRGLMAKPTGEIIEQPIKANFREGLTVLEYFSSTHGARKGLADTALKTADSGYLTRKLADVAQNVVITAEDCGTTRGITKGVIYRGEQVEVRLVTAINGRVSRQNIVNPVTDEVVVKENQMITPEIARKIEDLGLEKIQVRSPMTCDAPLGVCRRCYGMDMSTGDMVEEGMAVGIIAAQSIGEPGTQLTMRTFHIGGTANTQTEKSEESCRKAGTVKITRMRYVTNDKGDTVVLTRNGEIVILDPRGRELESHKVPAGAILHVEDGQEVKENTVLCQWNPFAIPVLSEVAGRVRYEDVVEGETMQEEKEASGTIRRTIIDFKGDMHPQIVIEDSDGKALDVYYLPERANIVIEEGEMISAGSTLAETPREASGVSDITGGLPRVTEIFEARKPKDPAVLAEIDGVVEIMTEKKRGKMTIMVRSETGQEAEHLVPPGKRFRVHTGDHVKAGQQLIDGPLVPHDILRVSGEEAVQQYLLHEIQQVYRSQRVEINDKHIEIIVARMLRKVMITEAGDTALLPGLVCDRFDFQSVNDNLAQSLRITEPGESDFSKGQIVPKVVLEETNTKIETLGGTAAKGTKPKPARYQTQLLGITKASVQSSSFISAASFQETTKVLTEAALSGKVDKLVGLKENVILGHLIPAGTGFASFQESEVQYNLDAMREFAAKPPTTLVDSFPLLEQDNAGQVDASSGFSAGQPATGHPGALQPTPGLVGAPPMQQPTSFAPAQLQQPMQPVAGDDLTQIEGIGPQIQSILYSAGITTYAQLAEADPAQLSTILVASAGGSYASHDPTTWPDQSKLAAVGEWDKLKAWQGQLDGGQATEFTSPAPVGNFDDLIKIEGIGPKVQDLLYSAGITTYAQLAEADPTSIRTILVSAGGQFAVHDPSTWPDQAKLAAVGEWDKLFAWQDQLDGGRETQQPAVSAPLEDLTRIEGIGPKAQELLYAAGVTSYSQLGQLDANQILGLLGGQIAAVDTTTWADQAKLAAAGEWDKLTAWQDQLDGGRATEPQPQANDPVMEDLKRIEGIGPKIEEVLYAAGITSYAQLAQMTPEQIRGLLAAEGGNLVNHDPTTWADQAKLAAVGEWDKLQAWQDQLHGGR